MQDIAEITGKAAAAPAPPSAGGLALCIVVGVVFLCWGVIFATDFKRAATRLTALAMSTQQSKPPRIYGPTPAGALLARGFGYVFVVVGLALITTGTYLLMR